MNELTDPKPNANASCPDIKIGWAEKIGYASGDCASNLYWGIVMFYMNYYFTDVLGIAATAAFTMIMITRTWDWINDPIMGMIADRTNTKMGKFRPWILWMIPAWIVIGILTFTAFDLSATGKLVYAYVSYTLFTMVYTAINIPYSALLGVMTNKSEDRTILSSYRFFGAFGGSSFVAATMLFLVGIFGQGNEKVGFACTVALYALMSGGLFYLTFRTCKERVPAPKVEKVSLKSDFKNCLRNGPWLVMILVSVLTIMWIGIRSGATVHYFKYVVGNLELSSLFITVSTFSQLVGVAFTKHIARALGGKKRAFMMINFICAGLVAAFYFIDPSQVALIIGHQFLCSVIAGPLMPMFWSMIADTADYGTYKLGQTSKGLLFSAGTLSQKLGWTIGPAIPLWLLGFWGFVANQEQSAETLNGLQLMMSVIPAIFCVLAGLAVMFYKIDNKMEAELEELSQKAAA